MPLASTCDTIEAVQFGNGKLAEMTADRLRQSEKVSQLSQQVIVGVSQFGNEL